MFLYGRTVLVAAIFVAGCTSAPEPAAPSRESLSRVPPIPKAAHVIVISADGLRPDAITPAVAPFLYELTRRSLYFPRAQTINPPLTMPAHASMLTGLDYPKHGVTWNDHAEGRIPHETIFSIAKRNGHSTAAIYGKVKIAYLIDADDVDFIFGEARAEASKPAAVIANIFADVWPQNRFGLTFIHLRDPDIAGHADGWMTPAYLAAVTRADSAIARIFATVEASGASDTTAIIITSDHGGIGRDHADARAGNMTIPWIAFGPGITAEIRDDAIRVYDTAAAALALLGLSLPPDADAKSPRLY